MNELNSDKSLILKILSYTAIFLIAFLVGTVIPEMYIQTIRNALFVVLISFSLCWIVAFGFEKFINYRFRK